ncbi:MAG: hypothetical protein M3N97_16525 [Pseudomonadota bacterium]|nr:hypothetical protein [Pseudomonadota bacterium]
MSATTNHEFQQSEHDKIRAEIEKLNAETLKLLVESLKLRTESRWYPWVAVTGIFGAAFALVKYVL